MGIEEGMQVFSGQHTFVRAGSRHLAGGRAVTASLTAVPSRLLC
jgi:hypothetical protein